MSDSESTEDEAPPQKTSNFGALLGEDDSESSSSSSEEDEPAAEEPTPPPPPPKAQKRKKKKTKKPPAPPPANDDDDTAALDAAVAAARQEGGGATVAAPTNAPPYLRFEFGRVDTQKEVAAALGASGARRRGLGTRRSLLGAPPDGFGAAPTYGRGGLRCVKRAPGRARPGEQWHVFEASDAYAQATAESMAGDPNYLAARVAEKPYLAPPLVALATFSLRVGRKELAEPLLRRATTAYEVALNAGSERTRDLVKRAVLRVDAAQGESALFFKAIHVRARVAAASGAPETAANLFRFLLALDPLGDPCGVLLRLDADLLQAGDNEAVLALFDAPMTVAKLPQCDVFDDAPRRHTKPHTTHDSSSRLLPGLALNRALALLRVPGDRKEKRISATNAVADALAAHPHLLTNMLGACGINPNADFTTSYDFREVVVHEHFRKQTRRACLANAYSVGAYELALDAACIRGRKLWAEPDALKLLHDGAQLLSRRLGPGKASLQTLAIVDAAWSRTSLVKYARVPIEAFADDLPVLGPDAAEGFDDSLLTAAAHQRAQQQQQQRIVFNRRPGGVDMGEILAQLPPDLREDFQRQLDAGVPPEQLEEALLRLVM